MTTKTIINTRPADLVTELKVRLRPGENVISEDKARTLLDSKAALLWRKLGWIRVKPVAAKPTDLAEDLDGGDEGGEGGDAPAAPTSAKDAIALIATEDDVQLLERMLGDESRKTVRSAVERRLAELAETDSGDGDEG